MAKAKRLFQISKELGVESKVVLEKCRAEGIELQNHMAAISVGLEATIREWFSISESHSAIETAEKVDLPTVRKAARSKARKKAASDDASDDGGVKTAVAEPPAETEESVAAEVIEEVDSPVVEVESRTVEADAHIHAPAAEAVVAEAESVIEPMVEAAAPVETEVEVETVEAVAQSAEEAAPAKPEPVKPGGKMLEKPKAAKLKGPRVVRIEQPEVMDTHRARRGSVLSMPTPDAAPLLRSRGPERGRGVGAKPGPASDDNNRGAARKGGGKKDAPGAGRKGKAAEAEARGKWSAQDLIEREERLNRSGGFLRQRKRMKAHGGGGQQATAAEVGGKVEVSDPITIKDLSAATGLKAGDIIRFLFEKGVMTTINAIIDAEAAMEVCLEYDIELVVKEAQTAEEKMLSEIQKRDPIDGRRRPPVVAVLGHVDHGKTSLLDRIRKSDVASGEDGGITQHIGAYRVSVQGSDGNEKTVVFLDTPGHQAFTAMRARGANLTDIVVVVVAADDGLMPQSVESINHAKAANVPVVVALNKIDKPEVTDAKINAILGQLAEKGLNPSEWGGTTEVVRTSATTGQGIADLIETLDYQAELLDLKADYAGPAHGQVIESEIQVGRGPVARLLVQEGQLKVGSFVVAGRAFGRVRDIMDDRGRRLTEAGPSTPVEVSGLDTIPDAGDRFFITESLQKAEKISEDYRDLERKKELAAKSKVTRESMLEQMGSAKVKEIRVVVKGDVQGSVEVIRKTLNEMKHEEVEVKVLHAAVGGITETDVLLAEASQAIIIGFHVIASQKARAEAEVRKVNIRLYRVIYDICDDLKKAMEGMLAPEMREDVLGHAEVRDVFKISKVGSVAGCYVTDGVIQRNAMIRVTRSDIVVEHDRKLEQLKRFKDDAREVRAGTECGMKIEGYDDIRPGDILECYLKREERKTL